MGDAGSSKSSISLTLSSLLLKLLENDPLLLCCCGNAARCAPSVSIVECLAAGKAQVISKARPQAHEVILGCDSVLAINGVIHGKPANPEEAIARWKEMRNQVGYLYTGHALIDQRSHRHMVRHQRTDVYFADVSDAQIEAYVSTEEPLHCAGCFALDGRGGLFIKKIEGCHSNVIGLSLPLLNEMLTELGYEVTEFWT